MKKRVMILASTTLLVVVVIAILVWGFETPEEDTTRLRGVNAAQFFSALDVEIDATPVHTDILYKDVTGYMPLSPGTHDVAVRAGLARTSRSVGLIGGLDATVIGIHGSTWWVPDFIALVDDNRPPNANTVRVVHLARGTGPIDVVITGGGGTTAGVSDLEYKAASVYLPGSWNGLVTLQVSSGGERIALDPPTATLRSNAIHTIFVMGQGLPLAVIYSEDERFSLYEIYLPTMIR